MAYFTNGFLADQAYAFLLIIVIIAYTSATYFAFMYGLFLSAYGTEV
ncbi:MAG: hypothetical protein RAK22_03090 [Nanoarchaeota archaeon]|nr:hypothetical protein [Nanoarchaeota archaeon]